MIFNYISLPGSILILFNSLIAIYGVGCSCFNRHISVRAAAEFKKGSFPRDVATPPDSFMPWVTWVRPRIIYTALNITTVSSYFFFYSEGFFFRKAINNIWWVSKRCVSKLIASSINKSIREWEEYIVHNINRVTGAKNDNRSRIQS